MAEYIQIIEPQIPNLEWQVTHNDPSPFNTTVTSDGLGFIDFGDGCWSPRIQDLAIAADRIKLAFWDGSGVCLVSKRLEDGEFRWPKMQDGAMSLTAALACSVFGNCGRRRIAEDCSEDRGSASEPEASPRLRFEFTSMPETQPLTKRGMARRLRRMDSLIASRMMDSQTLRSSSPSAVRVTVASFPMTRNATCIIISGMTGLTLPSMIDDPGGYRDHDT